MTLDLHTPRLLLRAPQPSDLDRIVALANNWKIASMLGRMSHPYGHAEAEAFLQGVAADPDEGTRAICLPEGVIGFVGQHLRPGGSHEIGYWLGEPYWGQGYAPEAITAILNHGFDVLALPYATAGHFVDNPASRRVLEKLGFRYIGHGERACLARRVPVESRELRLTRAEWANR